MTVPDPLESPASLKAFVAAWEAGTLPKSAWTHAAHVAVCAVLIVRSPEHALEHMTDGIIRYNEAVGTANTDCSGYHATLTRFWFEAVSIAVADFSDEFASAVEAVKKFGAARDLHSRFYSFDVLRSINARRIWLPPDLLDHRSALREIA